MTDPSPIEIVISVGGSTRTVYDERLDLTAIGRVAIQRASHVEPSPSGEWLADLSPVDGPSPLGPFGKRSESVSAEVAWLQQNWLTRPRE